ncbi:MAG: pyridoxal-phosphate dependent enzyme [Terriglobales bacterium]
MSRIATMGEGNTPLVESVAIGPQFDIRLWFKLESCNPTGSYKDRFIAAQVTEFLRDAVTACIATSSGNTGSSLAAYCARCGITCAIFVNEHAPSGKLHQMQGHGARVFRIRDFITSPEITMDVYRRLRRISDENSIPVVVSAFRYCPDAMRAVQGIAQELAGQLSESLDHVFVPVGGAGLFVALCRGFAASSSAPSVHAVQPEGCATVVSAHREGRDKILPITSTTRVSGLAVPFDIDASVAVQELRRSGGAGIAVSDSEVFAAQRMMLRQEGIWAEPAGAAALAGCIRAVRDGRVTAGQAVVCLVTGHGFKDPDSLGEAARENTISVIDHTEIIPELLEARV